MPRANAATGANVQNIKRLQVIWHTSYHDFMTAAASSTVVQLSLSHDGNGIAFAFTSYFYLSRG
jgi:hypothetical protein